MSKGERKRVGPHGRAIVPVKLVEGSKHESYCALLSKS